MLEWACMCMLVRICVGEYMCACMCAQIWLCDYIGWIIYRWVCTHMLRVSYVQYTRVYWTCMYRAMPPEAVDTIIWYLWELSVFVALGTHGCFWLLKGNVVMSFAVRVAQNQEKAGFKITYVLLSYNSRSIQPQTALRSHSRAVVNRLMLETTFFFSWMKLVAFRRSLKSQAFSDWHGFTKDASFKFLSMHTVVKIILLPFDSTDPKLVLLPARASTGVGQAASSPGPLPLILSPRAAPWLTVRLEDRLSYPHPQRGVPTSWVWIQLPLCAEAQPHPMI